MRTTILFLISIILAAGCVRTADTSSLEVDPACIICGNEGGEYEIHVTGPSGWVTDNTADWISVKKNGGDAIVTIDRNDGEARERTLNFTCNTAQASLKINQESSDIFSIDASSLHCSHKGGSFRIHVECYDDWTVSSGNQISFVTMPNLIGLTEDSAIIQLQNSCLSYGGSVRVESALEAGTVVGQDVAAFTEIEEHTKVILQVSSGIAG